MGQKGNASTVPLDVQIMLWQSWNLAGGEQLITGEDQGLDLCADLPASYSNPKGENS